MSFPVRNPYAARWRAAREEAGMSVLQVADALGVTDNSVYNWEKESFDGMPLRQQIAAATLYGKTLGEVYRDEAEPERIPTYLEPLAAKLLPLDIEARKQVIRNIASNLGFMASLYASSAPRMDSYSGDAKHNNGMTGGVSSDNLTEENQRLAQTLMVGNTEESDDASADAGDAQKGRPHNSYTKGRRRAL